MPVIKSYTSTDIHRIIDQGIDSDSAIAFYCQLITLATAGLGKKLDGGSLTDLYKIRGIAEARLTTLLMHEGWNLHTLTAPIGPDQ